MRLSEPAIHAILTPGAVAVPSNASGALPIALLQGDSVS